MLFFSVSDSLLSSSEGSLVSVELSELFRELSDTAASECSFHVAVYEPVSLPPKFAPVIYTKKHIANITRKIINTILTLNRITGPFELLT